MTNAEQALGKQLQRARQAAGLTQQDLCQRAGLSYSTLAKIERGAIKAPSVFTIQSIAAALGTTLSALVGEAATAVPTTKPKGRSKSGVRFVYFDINGCLVRFFHGAFTALAEDTGLAPDFVETTYWHYNDAVCRGDISMEEFNAAMAKRLGLPSMNWKKYYMAAISPIPEMHEYAAWVADHYHIGLLSNTMPGLIDEMFRTGMLPKLHYDQIIDSSAVHAYKPAEEIYHIAQERAGVAPEEILFIDDSRANLMAAERLGWRVLWFDDYRPKESVERIRQALELEA